VLLCYLYAVHANTWELGGTIGQLSPLLAVFYLQEGVLSE